jgi:hypothetical protein
VITIMFGIFHNNGKYIDYFNKASRFVFVDFVTYTVTMLQEGLVYLYKFGLGRISAVLEGSDKRVSFV